MMSMHTLGFLSLILSNASASPTLALPEVSKGTTPYASYSGTLCDTPTDIMTVPEGQDFLVTMVSTTTDGGSSRWGDWYEHHTSMLLRDEEIFNEKMKQIRALQSSNAEMHATIQSLRRQCQQNADLIEALLVCILLTDRMIVLL